MTAFDAEVIVVGGGPAGSATAMLLAQLGHDVMLLDKARFPRHKACSEYINTGAVQALDDLGVLGDVLSAEPHRMQAMHVHAPAGAVFPADFDRAAPGRAALGLTRHRFDAILLDHAREAGAHICEGAHVRAVEIDHNRGATVEFTEGESRHTLRSRLVIGADGHHSVVARSLGLDRAVPWPRRTALVAHVHGVPDPGSFGQLHVTATGYAGIAPLESGITNVAFVSGTDRVADRSQPLQAFFDEELRRIPAVADLLADAEQIGPVRGVGPLARRVSRPCGDRFLLVGDAAGFLDPFTGDGIYEGLRGALIAAPIASRSLRHGDCSALALEPYRRARRRAFTTKHAVCWIVQGFIHQPTLMNYATPRLSEREALGTTLSGVLGNLVPARRALSPVFLARLLRP
jgi:menaquinone-9 beta-reductase